MRKIKQMSLMTQFCLIIALTMLVTGVAIYEISGRLSRTTFTLSDRKELESAARVACGIPNEIVYMMCHLAELLEPVAENCSDAMVYNVLGAVHLAQGVIAAMRGEIKAVSQHMMEFTFRYTVNREAELNVQEHQELFDRLIEKLNARL